jgi:UDP-N-acetylmuramyl tripeptide synthase
MATDVSTSPVDSYLSPSSGKPLSYSSYFLSHLGLYEDVDGFKRPELTYAATAIKLGDGVKKSHFSLTPKSGNPLDLEVGLPGLYNVYNALAAASLGREIGLSDTTIATALSSLQSAFGRFERLSYQGKELVLCLIKNPVGASEVLRTVTQESRPFNLGFLANDNFADGQDVSWYWDTPYEQASGFPVSLVCGGSRAADMALRLKYAGYTQELTVLSSPAESLDMLIETSPGVTYILSTYTASLDLQKVLSKRGIKSHYWKE